MREARAFVVAANGARLYCELRGGGPSVLFISGATGDAGHFKHVASELADEFRVITYDRRGNSRSPRPAGWTTTSIAEQADDAAALLDALAARPAVVFGTSGGGTILVDLICRHAAALKGAYVHEPVLTTKSPHGAELGAHIQQLVEAGLARGGLRSAQELFLRWAGTDEVYDAMDGDLRERLLANGEVFFRLELERFVSYVPDSQAIQHARVPIVVSGGAENRGTPLVEGGEWLAAQLARDLVWTPGHHAPYWHPGQSGAFAEALRPHLRALAA